MKIRNIEIHLSNAYCHPHSHSYQLRRNKLHGSPLKGVKAKSKETGLAVGTLSLILIHSTTALTSLQCISLGISEPRGYK